MGGILNWKACPSATRRLQVWPWGLLGGPNNYINQRRFRHRENEADMQKGFIEKLLFCPRVFPFSPYPTRSYSAHSYISGNKKTNKHIISLYISAFVVLSVYNICNLFVLNRKSWYHITACQKNKLLKTITQKL